MISNFTKHIVIKTRWRERAIPGVVNIIGSFDQRLNFISISNQSKNEIFVQKQLKIKYIECGLSIIRQKRNDLSKFIRKCIFALM